MAQIGLYYRTQLETKISLLPEQIDGDIDNHLLKNLKAKIEGKTNENGIVLKINRLIDYSNGMIDKINSMGSTVFPIKYECFICSPTKDLEMICILENIVKGYLIAKNGPVIVAIQYNNIDTKKFEIHDRNIILSKTKVPVKKGDYLKVSVINIKDNLGEKNLVTMCKLLNMATKEEIMVFEEDQILATNGNIDDDNEFI